MTDPLDKAAERLAEIAAGFGLDAGEQVAALMTAAAMVAAAGYGVTGAAGVMRSAALGVAEGVDALLGAGQVRQ